MQSINIDRDTPPDNILTTGQNDFMVSGIVGRQKNTATDREYGEVGLDHARCCGRHCSYQCGA